MVDGDTLEIDGTIYRLNGIDAPEHGQRCGDWACGSDATNALADLVKGRDVTCQPIAQDRYGRVIATCFTGGRDISAAMIDNGLAWAFLKYSDAYETHQLVSKEKAQGVFSDDYAAPWDFRERRWKAAQGQERDAPSGCPIKGNISENGRIYHAPWSPWYDRTRINEGKGERWFCSESEAVAAGWRAPRWH
ncbi:MAG: thermonuclease family protein [Pseudomonadota bacterium]